MNTTGKIVTGVLAGAAVGALISMLFAPDSGTETRKKIVQKGTDLSDDFKEAFDDFLGSITEKFETVKKNATEMAEKGKSQLEDVKKEVKTASNGANGKYNHHHS
ncbi:MAG: YtxH domain-containing protein [Bacteroidia bacterium]|jgi:gas vesicle protein